MINLHAFAKDFGLKVRIARSRAKLTLFGAGLKVGMSEGTLAKIEKGKREPLVSEVSVMEEVYRRDDLVWALVDCYRLRRRSDRARKRDAA